MIDLEYLRGFFPSQIANNKNMQKHIVKEYLELLVLDHLSLSPFINKLSFIGGTNLRLVKGIDRFSEDLDFDCKDLSKEEFMEMTDEILTFLQEEGLRAETRDKDNPKLTAYRRNIYFPELLFELKLTGHKEERMLMKMEAQDQGIPYKSVSATVNRCNFYFQIPVPPDPILLSMKLSALITRSKGRDFYDAMFLLQQTEPDYEFLGQRNGCNSPSELKETLNTVLSKIDLNVKKKDFEHLLFNAKKSETILSFGEFINGRLG